MQHTSDCEFNTALWFGVGLAVFGLSVSALVEAKTGLVGSLVVAGAIGALIGMVEGFLLARMSPN